MMTTTERFCRRDDKIQLTTNQHSVHRLTVCISCVIIVKVFAIDLLYPFIETQTEVSYSREITRRYVRYALEV